MYAFYYKKKSTEVPPVSTILNRSVCIIIKMIN